MLLCYLTELADYLPLNNADVIGTYSSCASNVLLTNALNWYHPFIFFLSAVLAILSLLSTLALCTKRLPFREGASLSPVANSALPFALVNLIAL